MKIGTHEKEYTTSKTRWIVRGWSKQWRRYVYPHTGWSWTSWKPELSDTYKTREEAMSSVFTGYLRDMIDSQEIVDIHFFEEVVDREIKETRTVKCHIRDGVIDPQEPKDPVVKIGPHELEEGDYLVVNDEQLCMVESIRNNLMYLWVINGYWRMVINTNTMRLDPSSYKGATAKPIAITHYGLPDPNKDPSDYNAQFDALRTLNDPASPVV